MGPSSFRKTSSGLPLILHYGELYNYFIIYYNVIIIEIKCTINVMRLNHPKTIPPTSPWKNCLPWNQSLVPKMLGTAVLRYCGLGLQHKNLKRWKTQFSPTCLTLSVSFSLFSSLHLFFQIFFFFSFSHSFLFSLLVCKLYSLYARSFNMPTHSF